MWDFGIGNNVMHHNPLLYVSQRAISRHFDKKSTPDVKCVRPSKFYRVSIPGDGGR